MKVQSYYEVLGVSRSASLLEIKSAFRCHAKEWHPDRNKRPEAAERFRAYTEAYECLIRPEARAEYDALLRRAEQGFDERAEAGFSSAWQRRYPDPPRPSPLEQLLNEWNAKLSLDPALLVALFARIEAWLWRVMARNARRHP